ncbi:MAG: hypothetical protein NTZ24_10450 [Deltaproteobacteria bacterium]|nr:hypothetical protein [Deltaproteobacteria bacterium]
MDKKLKRLLIYYVLSAFCATVLISGAILSDHYITSLSNTLNQFQTLKINHIKMKGSIKEMEITSEKIHSMVPPNYKVEEMEGAILMAVDSIRSRMKGTDMMVGNFDRKENEVALPITLKGAIGDYTTFISDIGYLQSLMSPFMFINSVSILKSSAESKEAVNFDIRGVLKIQSRSTGGRT